MKRVLFVSVLLVGTLPAQPSGDDPQMSPADHAPLFRANTVSAGKVTESVTETLTGTVTSAPVIHRNFIDDEIFGKIKRDRVPHAPLATDREFLRRVKLDLTGRIPSSAEVRDFLADQS